MNRIIIVLQFLCFSQYLVGQKNLNITVIPAEFQSNLDAVIRFDDTELIIDGQKSYTIKKHWAVTIFNETGEDEFGTLKIYYDKFSTIKNIEGKIYDAAGKELKSLKNSEVKDYATGSFGDDITDNHIKLAEFNKKYYPYPFTIEFEYEEKSKNMLFLPSWTPIEEDNIATIESTFKVISPTNFEYQKKELYLPKSPIFVKNDLLKTEFWSIENFKAPSSEPYTKVSNYPRIILAPLNFIIDDFEGSGKSWHDLALFYNRLNSGRDKLPQDLVKEIQLLVANENTAELKVKKVYEYLQAHSRYQNISLGIGGWQTRLASEVAQKGYGDCKALTNFTIALLGAINIKAYPALIKAGDDAVFENQEVPRMAFNHVIACVPMAKDTIWLECTSQDNPFGYQGDFTGNRKALLIKPEKGELVNTIHYTPENNYLKRKAEILISETGDANIKFNAEYSGIQQEFRAELYKTKSPKEQKEWLIERYKLPNLEVVTNSFTQKKNKIPQLLENIELNSKKFGTITGKRIFLKLNLFSVNISPPAADSTREHSLFLNPNSMSFVDIDSLTFELPKNYSLESIPKDTKMSYKFGDFSSNYKVSENKITYYRKWKVIGGSYPKESYAEWVEFLKKIVSIDKQKVVLVKKES